MAVDLKKYLTDITKSAGASEAETQALLGVLSNDKLAKALGDDIQRHDEFSRSMDQLRTQQKEFEAKQAEWTTWYEGAVQQDTTRQQQLDAYRQRFGELDANANGNPNGNPYGNPSGFDPSKYVSRDDYQKAIQEAETRALGTAVQVSKELTRCSQDYFIKFGKPLDVDAFEKFALESRLPLRNAYDSFIAPEVKAKTDAEFEAKLRAAKEEGAREALSKHNLPTEAQHTEPHVLFEAINRDVAKNPVPGERARMDSFAEAWAGANKQ